MGRRNAPQPSLEEAATRAGAADLRGFVEGAEDDRPSAMWCQLYFESHVAISAVTAPPADFQHLRARAERANRQDLPRKCSPPATLRVPVKGGVYVRCPFTRTERRRVLFEARLPQ